jgi:hypothetical protein
MFGRRLSVGGPQVHPLEHNQPLFLSSNESDCVGQSEAIKVAVARALLPHDKSGELNEYRRLLRNGISSLKCELTPCSKMSVIGSETGGAKETWSPESS